jgi:hypothetical protein
VVAVLLAVRPERSRMPLLVMASVSLLYCIVCLWSAVVGAVIDVVLISVALRAPQPLFSHLDD